MSKLYDTYLALKETNDTKIYLFECGVFYICLEKDADIISNKLDLKKTMFNKEICKCGFPKSQLEKYEKLLKKLDINYELIKQKKVEKKNFIKEDKVNYIDNNIALNHYLNYLTTLNLDNISDREARYILTYIQGLIVND